MFSVQKLFKFSMCICITLILWKLFSKTEMQQDIIMTGIQKKVINTEIHILYSLLDRPYLELWVFVAYFGRKILWSLTNGGLKINCKFWFSKKYIKSTFISEIPEIITNCFEILVYFLLKCPTPLGFILCNKHWIEKSSNIFYVLPKLVYTSSLDLCFFPDEILLFLNLFSNWRPWHTAENSTWLRLKNYFSSKPSLSVTASMKTNQTRQAKYVHSFIEWPLCATHC